MNPVFAYPHCPTCNKPVERLTIEWNDLTGSYLVNVRCHSKVGILRITEDDMVGFETGPLVNLKWEETTI